MQFYFVTLHNETKIIKQSKSKSSSLIFNIAYMPLKEKKSNKLIVLQTYSDCNKTNWPRLVSGYFTSNKNLSIQLNDYMIHTIHWGEGSYELSFHSTCSQSGLKLERLLFEESFHSRIQSGDFVVLDGKKRAVYLRRTSTLLWPWNFKLWL